MEFYEGLAIPAKGKGALQTFKKAGRRNTIIKQGYVFHRSLQGTVFVLGKTLLFINV